MAVLPVRRSGGDRRVGQSRLSHSRARDSCGGPGFTTAIGGWSRLAGRHLQPCSREPQNPPQRGRAARRNGRTARGHGAFGRAGVDDGGRAPRSGCARECRSAGLHRWCPTPVAGKTCGAATHDGARHQRDGLPRWGGSWRRCRCRLAVSLVAGRLGTPDAPKARLPPEGCGDSPRGTGPRPARLSARCARAARESGTRPWPLAGGTAAGTCVARWPRVRGGPRGLA